MSTVLDPKTVAVTNPDVDVKKLDEVEQIRRTLESAGVAKKADYRLSPPLGTGAGRPAGRQIVVRLTRQV